MVAAASSFQPHTCTLSRKCLPAILANASLHCIGSDFNMASIHEPVTVARKMEYIDALGSGSNAPSPGAGVEFDSKLRTKCGGEPVPQRHT